MKKYKNKIEDFFKWVKGTELVELDDIDVYSCKTNSQLDYTRIRGLCVGYTLYTSYIQYKKK